MPPKKQKDEEELPFSDPVPKISFNDLERSMTRFSGDDNYAVTTWIKDLEDIALLMQWGDIEKFIYAKRLLAGTAKLFLRTCDSQGWTSLKEALIEEFGIKLNSAAIHKRLAARKMKNNETFQQYFLSMKEIAMLGSIENESLIEYVIDGIRDSEVNKSILYGAADIKEFRKKLDLYSDIEKKTSAFYLSKPAVIPTTSKGKTQTQFKRCFNCGGTDHQSPGCTKGVKCFRCNEFGHKSNECPSNPKKSLKIQESGDRSCTTPYKMIMINGVEVKVLIDTGSDVNLVDESYFNKINDDNLNYDPDTSICLTGIAEHEIYTKGSFSAKIQIDDCYFNGKFYLVENNALPVGIILGNPILNDVEVNFSDGGISAKRILHLNAVDDYAEKCLNIGYTRQAEKTKVMINDYDDFESSVEFNIILTKKTAIHKIPQRILPLELGVVDDLVKPSSLKKERLVKMEKERLGEYVKEEKIRPSQENTTAVANFQESQNIKTLQSFVRLTDKLTPKLLIDILKKGIVFIFYLVLIAEAVKIATDCSALTMTLDLPPKVARWALLLEKYDYVIEYRPGTRPKYADALSRYLVNNVYLFTDTVASLKRAQDDDLKIKRTEKVLEKELYDDYLLENRILWNVKDERKLSGDDPTKCYRRINADQRSLNNTYQRSIGMTPFELLTGSKMRDNDDGILKLIEEENIQNYNEQRQELRRKAKESIQKIQEENRRNYNRKRKRARQYDVGDLVAIKRTQFVQGYKLHPKYLGPYEIVKEKNNDRYDLRKVGHGEGPSNTSSSADMMKPWSTNDAAYHSSETDE